MKYEHVDIRKPWLLLLIYLIHETNRLVHITRTHSKPGAWYRTLTTDELNEILTKLWRVVI